MSVSFISLNVQGLHSDVKRAQIFSLCHSYNISLLQETYANTNQVIEKWTKEWGGQALWSMGSNNSCGVAILFSPGFNADISLISSDCEGRAVSACVKFLSTTFNVCCVYAPNVPHLRRSFLSSLDSHFGNGHAVIIGGDFNCIESDVDKRGGSDTSLHSFSGREELQQICAEFDLVDIWRVKNHSVLQFTWRNSSNTISTRLDRLYIPCTYNATAEIIPCPYSDHDAVSSTLTLTPSIVRGRGSWKCNTSHLADKTLLHDLELIYRSCLSINPRYSDLGEWWEMTKERFKNTLKIYAIKRNSTTKAELIALQKRFRKLTSLLNEGNSSPDVLNEYNNVKIQLSLHSKQKLEGAKIRSRVRVLEHNEKSSHFFLARERRRGNDKLISEIYDRDGNIVHSQGEITTALLEYFQSIFTSEPSLSSSEQHFFLSHTDKRLSEIQKASLEGALLASEVHSALKSMPSNKTPGSDGLPKEFYVACWPFLGDTVTQILNHALLSKRMCTTQRQGLVTLIKKPIDMTKPDSNIAHLKPQNKRPITLLNVDYKLISKVLTNRLKKVMPDIICPFQTCGVPGRSIHENVQIMRDINLTSVTGHVPWSPLTSRRPLIEWNGVFCV